LALRKKENTEAKNKMHQENKGDDPRREKAESENPPGVEEEKAQPVEQGEENQDKVIDLSGMSQEELLEATGDLVRAYATLEKDSQDLRAAKEEQYNQLLRLQADFDNFRRRTRTEKETWRRDILADLVAALLPVLDNFDLALQSMAGDGAAKQHTMGIAMIHRHLREIITGYGVEIIEDAGVPFDPLRHDAIGREKVADETCYNTVLSVQKPGYLLGEKLIRPALVTIAVAE